MRLINASTFELEEFFDDRIPPYAILSHTWGEDEVDFRGFYDRTHRHGVGWVKITNSCKQAVKENLGYVWVDTCCIDKTSSAELQESINSMFNYYRDAAVCYAFLVDVTDEPWNEQFRKSRWFKRGWTLQELLAPREVVFFANIRSSIAELSNLDIGWKWIGRRGQNTSSNAPIIAPAVLGFQISEITRIEFDFVVGIYPLSDASVATRMAWAAGRQTTRKEDRAYSLLGLFNINMPLLYGEGHRAFERLQKEIMAVSDDETILAWHYGLDFGKCTHGGLFARTPDCYKECIELVRIPPNIAGRKHYTLTNKGLWMKGIMEFSSGGASRLLGLNCTTRDRLKQCTDTQTGLPGALAIDVVEDLGARRNIVRVWRASTSVPFSANSDIFMTRLNPGWLKDKSRLSNFREANSSVFFNEGCRFYIDTAEVALSARPFVLFIPSNLLASLEDANIKLIKVDPPSVPQVIYQFNEEEWDEKMLDQSRTAYIKRTLTLIYQRVGSVAWYQTSINIDLETSKIRRNAEREYISSTASRIHETVLEGPDVKTTTHQLPPGIGRHELLKSKDLSNAQEISTGVQFHIKVLTYKKMAIYTLGCTIDQTHKNRESTNQ